MNARHQKEENLLLIHKGMQYKNFHWKFILYCHINYVKYEKYTAHIQLNALNCSKKKKKEKKMREK